MPKPPLQKGDKETKEPKEGKELKETKELKDVKEIKETKEKGNSSSGPIKSKLPGISSDSKSHIPRNVNYYSHFLIHPYITEKDVEWVLKLRNYDPAEMQAKLARIPNQPFSVAERKIDGREQGSDPSDITYQTNVTSVLHLLRHRLGPTVHKAQAEFETGLRSYGLKDVTLKEKERKWTNVPKKDRHDFPEFLMPYQEEATIKKEMKETGKLKKTTYNGFDPDINYPPYSMKFKQVSIQNVRHLFSPGAKMSTVQWEEGLRELKPIKQEKKDKDKDNNGTKPKLESVKKK